MLTRFSVPSPAPAARKPSASGRGPRRATREERAEAKQRKYRYLYQVRTAHGDVISQVYYFILFFSPCGGGEPAERTS